jgi:fructokinase
MSASERIVVCGESLMDVFLAGETPAGLDLNAVVGGSPLNVAMGVARLGLRSTFFGGVSTDFLGQRILRTIEREGIDQRALVLKDAPTTLSLVGVDAQGVPSYRFYGAGAADRQLEVSELARVPADAAAIHMGSYACVVEPVAGTLKALVEARKADTVIAYDPNVRLNVEPTLSVWRDHIEWMSHRVHFLKLSDEDFGRLYPEAQADDLAQQWLSHGVKLVMMTRGGAGAICWSAAGRCEVDAPKVTVVDTVGAGDTFQATVLVALAELGRLTPSGVAGLTLDEIGRIARFATQAAAITCTRQGPDLPRRDELPSVI